MNKLLQEIRNQPEHIRHVIMWLCVVITFSLVGYVWFRSTQSKFVAMLHPEEFKQQLIERGLALEKTKETGSPLSGLGHSFALLKASLADLLSGQTTDFIKQSQGAQNFSDNFTPAKTLPLSGNK